MFRRFAMLVIAVLTTMVLGASTASANGNPHFIQNQTKASLSGTDLVVKFKEAGLPSGATVDIEVSAHLVATYQCVNNGGNVPSDPKKTTINSDVAYSESFTAGRNGQITGTLVLSAPDAASVLDCPGGQKSMLTEVTWSNIVITDLDNGNSLAIPGTFSAGEAIGGKGKK
jgi:hypothetical protein